MFTGIIQEMGSIGGIDRKGGGVVITVKAAATARELAVDDSVALNGVCQTVVRVGGDTFAVEAVEETLKKTTLGAWQTGDRINLELAVRVGDRLGGHLVQGHVDCVGEITGVEERPMSRLVRIGFPERFSRYVIPVGSVAVDGISLTVAGVEGRELTVSVIPHTLAKTTLAGAARGQRVNLEFDVIGKYIERLLPGSGREKGNLTAEKLARWGFGA